MDLEEGSGLFLCSMEIPHCTWCETVGNSTAQYYLDCKTVGFFLKFSKEIGKAWRKSYAREAHEPHTPIGRLSLVSLSVFSLVPDLRAYLNTQKYGLFCSLNIIQNNDSVSVILTQF